MFINVESPERQPKWLLERHKNWHANRPKSWDVKVNGCQECLLEIIWKQDHELILGICRFHDQVHPNILRNEYHLATHQAGYDQVVYGWFKGCSRCIDIIFIAWSAIQKELKPLQN